MQLLGIKNDQFFRNRLTHSLEVAQIVRSIAGTIQYEAGESYVVEAGAWHMTWETHHLVMQEKDFSMRYLLMLEDLREMHRLYEF